MLNSEMDLCIGEIEQSNENYNIIHKKQYFHSQDYIFTERMSSLACWSENKYQHAWHLHDACQEYFLQKLTKRKNNSCSTKCTILYDYYKSKRQI